MPGIEIKKAAMPGVNFLEDDACQSYFETREYQSFFAAIKHTIPRRDFHSKLIAASSRFLDLTSSSDSERLIDSLIGWSVKNGAPTSERVHDPADPGRGKAIAAEVQRRYPHGYDILEMYGPATFASLKSAYRSAVKKHHPDCGGSHQDMVELNAAYVLCEELLHQESLQPNDSRFAMPGPTDPIAYILTCQDFRYSLTQLLFAIHLDDWAVDKAFQYLKLLLFHDWSLTGTIRQSQSKLTLCEDCTKLALIQA